MIPQYRPLIDRKSLAQELYDYTMSDGYFTEFRKTEEFERKIAEFLKVKHCFTTNNGTISLSLALLAHGIGPRDVVIVPNITMIATINAVRLIGAIPQIVDVDLISGTLDLNLAKRFMNNCKAIIYVTLNGRSHCIEKMDKFRIECLERNIALICDNAQSFGSLHDDAVTPISCLKNGIGSFSFSMPKIITTGQGGCLVTNEDHLAKKIRELKDFGRTGGGNDRHDEYGINCKFTEPQAIMGLNQITSIEWRIAQKKKIYDNYKFLLSNVEEIRFMPQGTWTTPWFVDIYTDTRDKLKDFLKDNGIGSRAIYPQLSQQGCNGVTYNLKNSSYISERGLWLPSSLDLETEDIIKICTKIKEFYSER